VSIVCAECGQLNAEQANYCQRCGAQLERSEAGAEPPTATFRIDDDTGELVPLDLDEVTARGPALVVRSGRRAGQSFPVNSDRMSIGRRPDADVFLDDITVSRDHAVLIKRGAEWYLDDCGSLNGTYVNRSRIDSHRLEDADEVQVGKYKLTFRAR
jgi:pSer/pThr/pTyr-binding forkhead associated (FHA) protein